MKFCQNCAAPILRRVPEGDDKLRHCCDSCDTIFYENPKNVVGTLPVFEDKVLLCKRAIDPRKGKWTLPAGFLENGESTLDGALRETSEEAGAAVEVDDNSLYTIFNLPAINQVYLFFRVKLSSLNFSPGIESLEVQLFSEHEIPWDEIAFPVIRSTLEHYFSDRAQNKFPVRMFTVHYSPDLGVETQLLSTSESTDTGSSS